jgi:hypothetical protein
VYNSKLKAQRLVSDATNKYLFKQILISSRRIISLFFLCNRLNIIFTLDLSFTTVVDIKLFAISSKRETFPHRVEFKDSLFLCQTVQPVPAPCSTNDDNNKRISEGGSNQNEILFIRGKLISGAPIKIGTSQFIERNNSISNHGLYI